MPVCGSGVLVCSLVLLIRGPILPAVRQKLHLSPCADSRTRLSPMSKSMALSTIDIDIPDEIWDLLGEPPVHTEEERIAFEMILRRFVQAVHPRDIVEWIFVWDLTVYRAAIQWLQRLKTRLIQQAH